MKIKLNLKKKSISVLYLLLVTVLLISFNSCGNNEIDEVHPQDNVTIEYYTEYQARTTGNHYLDLVENGDVPIEASSAEEGPTPDCPYEECDIAIPEMAIILQQLANAQCEEVWNCISCCIEGNIIYALMYAAPQSPPCPVTSRS